MAFRAHSNTIKRLLHGPPIQGSHGSSGERPAAKAARLRASGSKRPSSACPCVAAPIPRENAWRAPIRRIPRGVSVDAANAKGEGPAHFAAKRHSSKLSQAMSQTLTTLSLLGIDWRKPNARGISGLAQLAAKGPLEEISLILQKNPKAVSSGGNGAITALGALSARGQSARAIAEKAAMEHVNPPCPSPSAPRRASRL